MDFFVALRLIARRWYVVASALVITVVVAFTVMQSVAPSYRAEGSVLLYAPSAGDEEGEEVNPFRSFDSSTSVLAAVMIQVMNDPAVRNSVGLAGGRPDYEVGLASDGTPVIVMRGTDTDESVAIETVNLATDALQEELDRRQGDAGAPDEIRIRAIVLTDPDSADLLVGDRIRAFIVVLAIGVAASISSAFLAESLSQSSSRRRDSRSRGTRGAHAQAVDEFDEFHEFDEFDELVRGGDAPAEPVSVSKERGPAEP